MLSSGIFSVGLQTPSILTSQKLRLAHILTCVLVEDQERTLWIGREGTHIPGTAAEQCFDHGGWDIANSNPDHFGRGTKEKTSLMEISVLCHDGKAVLCSVLPDYCISCLLQPNFADVSGVRIFLLQGLNQTMREILIEKELHDGGIDTSFRSRSAAKAKQARMSSRVRSGKSLRISSSLIPEARYSKTSYTVIRRPRMQGFPPRFSGSMVMRFFQSMISRVAWGTAKIKAAIGSLQPPPILP